MGGGKGRAKRVFDVLFAVAALGAGAPLFVAVALAVKVSSPGPVLFCQQRAGRDGRPFTMYKFRSMVFDAEARRDALEPFNEVDGPAFKMSDDPRVTPLGRWLRRTSLDELPQFYNVLVGDMSVVGPRPPLVSEWERYTPLQRGRLAVKPGLTCFWQVQGRSDLDFDTWLRLDLDYVERASLALDVELVLRTVPAVLSMRGAR